MSARDRSSVALDIFTLPNSRPTDKVSDNFQLWELTRSELAARQGINNSFESVLHMRAAVNLAREVMQPVREQFGPFTPNSVYRSQALERALKKKPRGWVSAGQHPMGEAVDFEIVGVSNIKLAQWCVKELPTFDQLILECHDPRHGANSGWVHVSLRAPWSRAGNRREVLSYIKDPKAGRWIYVNGLKTSK